MPSQNQLKLIKDPRRNTKLWWIEKRHVYGGALEYRKVARPFNRQRLVHVVFKAKIGRTLSFASRKDTITTYVEVAAKRYGVRIRDLAVHHEHIHVLFYTKTREAQARFLRLVSADIGRHYARIRRALNLRPQCLWLKRPFTRLVSWGQKSVARITSYIHKNRLECMGFVAYTPRNHSLSKFIERWLAAEFSTG